MSFDKNNKKNKPITDWYKGKTALILDSTPMNRTSIKKTLINYGLDKSKFYIPESIIEAREIIDTHKPQVVFVRDSIHDGKGIDLLELHVKTHPNRIDGAFFILTEDNSPASSCLVLDKEVDGILHLPFTGSSLNKLLQVGLKKKYTPGPYIRMVEEAKAKIIQGDTKAAMKQFKEASDMNKTPVLANYHMAKILITESDEEGAEDLLMSNLSLNSKHYKSLKELAKLYKKQNRYKDQYEMSSYILEYYSLNPEKIPDLTKLSIQNEKYEDVWNYAKAFSKIKNQSAKITQFISAGLAICGRFMVKTNRAEEGKKAIAKSAKLANGKFEILKNLSNSLLEINDKEGAEKILSKYVNENTDQDKLEIYNFELFSKNSLTPQAIEKGRKLIDGGFKRIEIYKIMIEKLVTGNAKRDMIEDLVNETKREFPDAELPNLN